MAEAETSQNRGSQERKDAMTQGQGQEFSAKVSSEICVCSLFFSDFVPNISFIYYQKVSIYVFCLRNPVD